MLHFQSVAFVSFSPVLSPNRVIAKFFGSEEERLEITVLVAAQLEEASAVLLPDQQVVERMSGVVQQLASNLR